MARLSTTSRNGLESSLMTDEINPFSLSSTYVVLGDNGNATPIAVSDRFFADLADKFGGFKGKRLISLFIFKTPDSISRQKLDVLTFATPPAKQLKFQSDFFGATH